MIYQGLAGRKLGTLAALILMAATVRGFRPVRAARLPTEKEPNPTKEMVLPFLSVFLTVSTAKRKVKQSVFLYLLIFKIPI